VNGTTTENPHRTHFSTDFRWFESFYIEAAFEEEKRDLDLGHRETAGQRIEIGLIAF
jgi:hypothetical protein